MEERGHMGEKKELVWIFLTTMVILALIALVANFTPQGATGHFTAVQNIAYLQGGKELPMAVKNVKGMYSANFELLEDIKSGQITFEEDDSIIFDGIAYSKFVVDSTDKDKLGQFDLTMKIKQADLKEIGLTPEDVALYVNGGEVRTRIDRTEGEYEFYTARSDEFGEFVIGKMREEEVKKEAIAPPQIVGEAAVPPPILVEPELGEEQVQKIGFWQKIVNFFSSFLN